MLLYQLLHTDIYPAAVTYAALTNLKKMGCINMDPPSL